MKVEEIHIKFIEASEQRYDTVGDWWFEDFGRVIQIRVTKLSTFFRSFLVAFHELYEVVWCMGRGVTQEEVDKFDQEFEAKRLEGDEREPGDDLNAPYREGHQFATLLERQAAHHLGIEWDLYDKEVTEL